MPRSLPKIDHLRALCAAVKYNVIVVTETWLSGAISDFEILFQGIIPAVKIEILMVEVSLSISVSMYLFILYMFLLQMTWNWSFLSALLVTVGGFYRPSSANRDYLQSFYDAVLDLNPRNLRDIIICGDFNIDYKISNDSILAMFENEFCLSQVVSEPTRISVSAFYYHWFGFYLQLNVIKIMRSAGSHF